MFVFIAVTLSIHGLVNYYILRRGWQALAGFPGLRWALAALYLLSLFAYPVGRIFLGLTRAAWAEIPVRFGSYHLALMLYLFMGVLAVDILRLANALFRFFPKALTADPNRTGLILFLVIFGASILTVLGGAVNASRPVVRELDLKIAGSAGPIRTLDIVFASDIHLGTTIRSRRLKEIVTKMNALGPDLVLLAGDVVDESMTAREEEKLTSAFRDLKAPMGIFSVPGNHEFYSGLERNLACLRRCGIRVLEDEAVRLGDSLILIGRKDPSALPRGTGRVPIPEIMARSDAGPGLPTILLDHQPIRLEEAEAAGIDLQLSGHTHAGQLFPLSLINAGIYEQNWGYLKKGRTQYYVSSGVCTWGPPVRTGSVPEIVKIRVTFGGDG